MTAFEDALMFCYITYDYYIAQSILHFYVI